MIQRPLDDFALHFYKYLITETAVGDMLYIARHETERNPRIKTLLCSEEPWARLYPLFSKTARGSPRESSYPASLQEWSKVNGYLLMASVMDTETGELHLVAENERETHLANLQFPPSLSAHDALVFLNTANIELRKAFLSKRYPKLEFAKTLVEHDVVAHECVHIAYNLAGRQMQHWDTQTYFESPEVWHLFTSFVSKVGEDDFRTLYKKTPLADSLAL